MWRILWKDRNNASACSESLCSGETEHLKNFLLGVDAVSKYSKYFTSLYFQRTGWSLAALSFTRSFPFVRGEELISSGRLHTRHDKISYSKKSDHFILFWLDVEKDEQHNSDRCLNLHRSNRWTSISSIRIWGLRGSPGCWTQRCHVIKELQTGSYGTNAEPVLLLFSSFPSTFIKHRSLKGHKMIRHHICFFFTLIISTEILHSWTFTLFLNSSKHTAVIHIYWFNEHGHASSL